VLYGSDDAVATEPLAGLGLPVTITGADADAALPRGGVACPFSIAARVGSAPTRPVAGAANPTVRVGALRPFALTVSALVRTEALGRITDTPAFAGRCLVKTQNDMIAYD
jgi:hypothetical protein